LQFEDLDDEEDKPKQPKFKKSSKGSGLFSVLPPPKNKAPEKKGGAGSGAASLVPLSVSRPKPAAAPPARPKLPLKKPLVSEDLGNDSDDDEDGGCDFFGFNAKDPVPVVPIVPTEVFLPPPSQKPNVEERLVANDVQVAVASTAGYPLDQQPREDVGEPSGSNVDLLQDEDAVSTEQSYLMRMSLSLYCNGLNLTDCFVEKH
jgi:hypothetical protein